MLLSTESVTSVCMFLMPANMELDSNRSWSKLSNCEQHAIDAGTSTSLHLHFMFMSSLNISLTCANTFMATPLVVLSVLDDISATTA